MSLGSLEEPRKLWLWLIVALAFPSLAHAQESVVQPGDAASERANERPPPPPADTLPTTKDDEAEPSSSWVESTPAVNEPPTTPPSSRRRAVPAERNGDERNRSYEARAVIEPVPGTPREEERIGDYRQPRWTAQRRFPNTRVYVRPAGTFGIEWWLEQKLSLEDLAQVRYRSQYELELGLGHRLQSDVYLQTEQDGHQGPWQLKSEKLELRWALADWGAIPLNPTLYAEFAREHDAPPRIELKALAGEELASRLHFGLNLVWEHELGDQQQNEYAITTGISYSIVDELFSLGAEVKLETTDEKGERLTFDNWALLAGPSLSWSPTPPMHVLLVALLGNETEGPEHTPLFEPTLILGWEL
jgi:hypothetical protein